MKARTSRCKNSGTVAAATPGVVGRFILAIGVARDTPCCYVCEWCGQWGNCEHSAGADAVIVLDVSWINDGRTLDQWRIA